MTTERANVRISADNAAGVDSLIADITFPLDVDDERQIQNVKGDFCALFSDAVDRLVDGKSAS